MNWNDDLQFLKGVGPKRAALFSKIDVHSLGELLSLYPRAYIDYSKPLPLAGAPFDEKCAVKAEVLSKSGATRISSGRSMFKVYCADESAALNITFFNNPYSVDKLEIGKEYIFYGKIGGNLSVREMISPSFIPAGKSLPLKAIYPLTAGLSNYVFELCVKNALEAIEDVPEPLSEELLQKYKLPPKKEALRMIHQPASEEDVAAARRRFVFEELYIMQLGMLLLQGKKHKKSGAPMRPADMRPFFKELPFKLTSAQQRCISEICGDMLHEENLQMNRLLQGDVGSGKTVCAAAAVYLSFKNNYQSALMAPTEILSRQHAETLSRLLSPLGLNVALITGAVKGKARTALCQAVKNGEVDLLIGTHAVLSEDIEFKRLGLVIADEQHRFGVKQRAALSAKTHFPHTLTMTATPIPRTLALLIFGDLDISLLDELPPGRTPVKTYAVTGKKRRDMFGFLQKQIAQGRQAYIVTPLIEEGESGLQAAESYFEEIAKPMLPSARVLLMHGKLKNTEKAAVMQQFKNHEADVLVSTTVIEVGVDVPNASVMVVEDAERYGLSALHQLRGRVGRGAAESHCVLISDHASEAARERLSFLCRTHNGFEIAKYDLETRGPGDFFGSRQHGLPKLNIADLATDARTLKAAQAEAIKTINADNKLQKPENAVLLAEVDKLYASS